MSAHYDQERVPLADTPLDRFNEFDFGKLISVEEWREFTTGLWISEREFICPRLAKRKIARRWALW